MIKEHKNLNVYPFWWHNWLEFQTWRLCWHRIPELTATWRLSLHPSSSWPTEYGCLQPWYFILYHCRLLIPFGVSSKSKSNIFPMDPQTSYMISVSTGLQICWAACHGEFLSAMIIYVNLGDALSTHSPQGILTNCNLTDVSINV